MPITSVACHNNKNIKIDREVETAFVNTTKYNWIMNSDTIKFYGINLVLMSDVIDSEVFVK